MTMSGVHNTAPQARERRTSGSGARHVVRYAVGGFALAGVLVGAYALVRPQPAPSPTPSSAATTLPAAGNATYGSLPAWLPRATTPVGRVVVSSADHPATGIEGDTMIVRSGGHQVTALAVGPSIPARYATLQQGSLHRVTRVPASFLVTLSHADGALPIASHAFVFFDENGRRIVPTVRTSAGRPAPPDVGTGATVTLRLGATLPTGPGELVWFDASGRFVAAWEYTVEVD